ncbi:unnamed protein product [Larinioides sclopetarius]|uniref:Uncharacterized protein n=1 Tax=Larinioides sclopetarius TaxID=280406 RepID=A0AAV2BRW6_9ARAC
MNSSNGVRRRDDHKIMVSILGGLLKCANGNVARDVDDGTTLTIIVFEIDLAKESSFCFSNQFQSLRRKLSLLLPEHSVTMIRSSHSDFSAVEQAEIKPCVLNSLPSFGEIKKGRKGTVLYIEKNSEKV